MCLPSVSPVRSRQVLHHPNETNVSLSSKKNIISHQQLVSPLASVATMARHTPQARATVDAYGVYDGAAWTATESDSEGTLNASYSARRGLFGRRHFRKRAIWSSNNPHTVGIDREANVSVTVDQHRVMRRLHSVVRLSPASLHQDALMHSLPKPTRKGFDFLPTAPTSMTWTLLPAPRQRQRSLGNAVAAEGEDEFSETGAAAEVSVVLATFTSSWLSVKEVSPPRAVWKGRGSQGPRGHCLRDAQPWALRSPLRRPS